MTHSNKALFLDRDGVINIDHGYVYKPEDIQFVEGIFELCKTAQAKGYLIFIITNQSGIARKYYSRKEFQTLSQWLHKQFYKKGIKISRTYYCPHHPNITHTCHCRKPRPGMLYRAIRDYQVNPSLSLMVGDKRSDMMAAKRAKVAKRVLFNQSNPKPFIPSFRRDKDIFKSRKLTDICRLL